MILVVRSLVWLALRVFHNHWCFLGVGWPSSVSHFILRFQTSVIYWPLTELSIKRCTCVNKWKNSGSRWVLENHITRCPDGLSQLETRCRSENQLQTEGATQAKMQKKCCYGRGRTWVNIAVCPCLHSFLTHNKHHSFKNKVWENYIFIRSVFIRYWSRHCWLIMFPCIFVWEYTTQAFREFLPYFALFGSPLHWTIIKVKKMGFAWEHCHYTALHNFFFVFNFIMAFSGLKFLPFHIDRSRIFWNGKNDTSKQT